MYKCSLTGDTIIFVDIDGPLLPARMHYDQSNAKILLNPKYADVSWQDDIKLKKQIKFDPVMISLINTWVEAVDAKIVMSTHWTKYSSLTEICAILEANGINHEALHENWKTTKLKCWTRADEIAHWLFDNSSTFSNYLIIEDDDTVLNDVRINPNKVLLIDFYNGIRFDQIFQGYEILGITDYNNISL